MSESSITSRLKEFLPAVPDRDLQLLADICTLKKYRDKEVILKSGNLKKKAFLILEGVARGFVVDSLGEEKTILLRGKGIFVGDVQGLFTDQPQKLEIIAAGQTEVLMFSFLEFEQLAQKNDNIQNIYLNSLKEAILRLTYRVESMATMNSEERYLDLLQMNPEFLEKSYDRYVAHYLGITPVSLSRIKKRINFSELTNVNLKKS
jgi:CRP-like cAMP-binding protein